VTACTHIAASPQEVWETVMDPAQLGKWVTIHRRILHADDPPPKVGYKMEQQIHLRGVSLHVRWTLVECLTAKRAVWQGRGPARSRAQTEYLLQPDGKGRALTTATSSRRRWDRWERLSAGRSHAGCPSARRSAHWIGYALAWRRGPSEDCVR